MIAPALKVVRQPEVRAVQMRVGFWLHGRRKTYMFDTLTRTRAWESHIARQVNRYLRRGWTFVDVGAGLGYWTLYASRIVGPAGRVVAFEPDPENYRLTLLSVRRARVQNMTVYPVAVSDTVGRARLWHDPDNDGDNRLTAPGKAGDYTDAMTVTLDDVFAPELGSGQGLLPWRVILKVDTQGHEAQVLAGAAQLLYGYRPIVIVEDAPELGEPGKVRQLLEESGYRVSVIPAVHGETSPDLLALPRR